MRLKLQMLVAGLVTLAIPIVGWHSIRQLDDALEDSRRQEQQLRVSNALTFLSKDERLTGLFDSRDVESKPSDIYAPRARFPLFVDGYLDDWRELTVPIYTLFLATSDAAVSASVSMRTAVRDKRLFVFIEVIDNDVVFHQPPPLMADYGEGEEPDFYRQLVNGDALEVLVQNPSGEATHGLFRAAAPGPLVARIASNSEHRTIGARLGAWRGHWNTTAGGFQLEIVMPQPADGATLGLAYVDVDEPENTRNHWIGNLDPQTMKKRHQSQSVVDADPQLHRASNEAFDALSPWVTSATRARLFDAKGRLLSDVSKLYEEDKTQTPFDPAKSSLWDALVFRFVSAMLRQREGGLNSEPLYERIDDLHMPQEMLSESGPLQNARRYQTDEADFVLGNLGTISGSSAPGYLLFESNDSRSSSYAGSRLARLMSLLMLVSLAVGGSLLIFATVLSIRIRRLSQQAALAVSKEGRIHAFAASRAGDEIGELSRTLGSLLGRTQHYTHYLEALSSRLSHELRTPLSVVKTSLENIDDSSLDDQTKQLLTRASGGTDQLSHIIRALVDSTRLEQTVRRAQKAPIPVEAFMHGAHQRYEQVYPNTVFHGVLDSSVDAEQTVYASPELLQQALDKLVDNAVSFTTDNSVSLTARIDSRYETDWLILSVSNPGHLSSNLDPVQAFDPMFSSRKDASEQVHLGLGLYIVRMVAEAHEGRAKLAEQAGVVSVSMAMPANVPEALQIPSD